MVRNSLLPHDHVKLEIDLFFATACQCDIRGVVDDGDCTKEPANEVEIGSCFCKDNVEGKNCDVCKAGFFGLGNTNPTGCIGMSLVPHQIEKNIVRI